MNQPYTVPAWIENIGSAMLYCQYCFTANTTETSDPLKLNILVIATYLHITILPIISGVLQQYLDEDLCDQPYTPSAWK